MKTLDKVLQVLDWVVRTGRPVTLVEVAGSMRLSMATAFRTLHALEAHGMLLMDPVTKAYRPGLGLWSLACIAVNRQGVLAAVHPVLEDLAEETGESANYAVYDRGEIVYLDKVDGPRAVAAVLRLGERAPAHCVSTGKAILASVGAEGLPAALRESLARGINARYVDAAAIERHLELVRRKGYAVNWQEYRPDISGIAAPVTDQDQRVRAAIAVAGPSSRLTPRRLESLAPAVVKAAALVSQRLGAVNARPAGSPILIHRPSTERATGAAAPRA